MNRQHRSHKSPAHPVPTICGALLLALLLATSLAGTAQPVAAREALQPPLREMALQDPAARVAVIVQKLDRDSAVEARVAELGGTVTKNLSIINAFAAELPAGQVEVLAQMPGVRWVSLDAPVSYTPGAAPARDQGAPPPKPTPTPTSGSSGAPINLSNLKNIYNYAVAADKVWNTAPYIQGQGVTVAVVDSGVNRNHPDFGKRVLANVEAGLLTVNANDGYGHGTFVAGIIAGNGAALNGRYIGIAPKANLVNVKVSTDIGAALESDVIAGLQWIYDNRTRYNIRVVNLSLNSTVAQSYHTSPIDAAVEILWFNGIVVVVSAGNNGTASLYPPANDPFVITVGATDDRGTWSIGDDLIASFSAYGTTGDGFAKPDLVAPGKNLVAPLASSGAVFAREHPANVVDSYYFRMSGTSAAAPVVSGAVALLLQDEPSLNPDQVKYRLKATAVANKRQWSGYDATKAGAGYLNIYNAVTGTTTQAANTGITASHLLWTGSEPVTWSSVQWNSVQWNSVQWNSVQWNSVQWNSVQWNSDYWGP